MTQTGKAKHNHHILHVVHTYIHQISSLGIMRLLKTNEQEIVTVVGIDRQLAKDISFQLRAIGNT
jgi:hypothetical protein